MDLFGVLDALWDLKDKVLRGLRSGTKRKQAALRSVSVALDETKLYYERIRRGGASHRGTEEKLARRWSQAAVALAPLDRNLARVCDLKASYWINPDQWSEDQIRRAGIKLEKLGQRYRKLLAPKKAMLGRRKIMDVAPRSPARRA